MKNKLLVIFLIGIMIFLIGGIYSEQLYCCEKTKVNNDGTGGVWCEMAEEDECDISFSSPAATSCESTSYCRLGCCYNTKDGSCSLNTPKKVCDEKGGVWNQDSTCNIQQCQKGCCIQGSNAFIDTITGCKYSSSNLGISLNFNQQITNEIECRLQVTSENKGACVYEENSQKTCKFTTQKECLELRKQETGETTAEASKSFFQRIFGSGDKEATQTTERSVEFYESKLCTNEELETNCLKTKKTTCSNDRVYFTDSCGNIGNIYDSSKYEDVSYWTRVYNLDESCGYEDGSKNSDSCGNCEYLLGSICGLKRTGDTTPRIGDYLCRSLDCSYQGQTYSHGESWCATKTYGNKGTEQNLPGSEYFVLKCNNGEVTSESCGSYREKICEEEEVVKGFSVAKCIANNWKDCYEQTSEKDCENTDKRDCKWTESKWLNQFAQCVPKNAPGFDFWEDGTDAESICARGTIKCKVTYDKGLFGDDYDCKKNCFCLTQEWKDLVSNTCSALGDCGVSVNYIGQEGYNEEVDLFKKI
jgi:hypothetical protein